MRKGCLLFISSLTLQLIIAIFWKIFKFYGAPSQIRTETVAGLNRMLLPIERRGHKRAISRPWTYSSRPLIRTRRPRYQSCELSRTTLLVLLMSCDLVIQIPYNYDRFIRFLLLINRLVTSKASTFLTPFLSAYTSRPLHISLLTVY